MNFKNTITMLTLVCLSATAFVSGCKKKEQQPPPPQASMGGMTHQGDANQEAQLASIEQKTCPVTEDKIDPNVFIEYKGKKVYFCCSMCVAQFNKNPEKYISKLPQFSK
jgi:YHS domain-containing protein